MVGVGGGGSRWGKWAWAAEEWEEGVSGELSIRPLGGTQPK